MLLAVTAEIAQGNPLSTRHLIIRLNHVDEDGMGGSETGKTGTRIQNTEIENDVAIELSS